MLCQADDNPVMVDVREVTAWLIDGARDAMAPEAVVAEMCARLTACGLPLWRVNVFVATLHPDLMGSRLRWEPGKPLEGNEAPIAMRSSEMYLPSPVLLARQPGGSLRPGLRAPDCPLDFPVLEELKAEGATDYLISPLPFIGGETHAISWTTRAPAGFSAAEIAALEAVAVPLARVAEVGGRRRGATTRRGAHGGRRAR